MHIDITMLKARWIHTSLMMVIYTLYQLLEETTFSMRIQKKSIGKGCRLTVDNGFSNGAYIYKILLDYLFFRMGLILMIFTTISSNQAVIYYILEKKKFYGESKLSPI